MIPAEFEVFSHRRTNFNAEDNNQLLSANSDLLKESREVACLKAAVYQQKMVKHYNKKVQVRQFKPGDLVL